MISSSYLHCETYQTQQRQKRAIRVKQFKVHITSNILDCQVTNNSRCYQVSLSQTEQYKHSFFVETVVVDWTHPTDDIGLGLVDAPSHVKHSGVACP